MKEIISVIIPVYQAKKFLYKCIDSVLSQTYQEIEVILIDDGSTDGSAEICDDYVARDNRVRVIHQKNAGVSAARNRGIEQATGQYLMFVDADDYVEKTLCENLMYFATTADLMIEGFIEDWGSFVKKTSVAEQRFYSLQELKKDFDILYKIPMLNSPVARLYKKKLLSDIKFDVDIPLGEDFLFNLMYYSKCQNIAFLPQTDYIYNQTNTNSATKKYKDAYFPSQKLCYINGKKFKYDAVKFTNDALDETFCANGINLIQLICYQTQGRKIKKEKIRKICEDEIFQAVCAGTYKFQTKMKIPQILCRCKKYNSLLLFYTVKRFLSIHGAKK